MDMRHRVYYAVNLNQNHGLSWYNVGYDDYGVAYKINWKKLKGAISSMKARPLRREYMPGRYFQQMISCKQEEEHGLVAMLDQLKLVNYEKLDGKEWV